MPVCHKYNHHLQSNIQRQAECFYRKSRYLLCGKADGKNAQAVSKTMIDLLLGATALSVTPDRGKEFARRIPGRIAFLLPAAAPALAERDEREHKRLTERVSAQREGHH